MIDSLPQSDGAPAVLPVSVVIPSYDRARLLQETVESVLAGDALPREIIIVDQSPAANERLAKLMDARTAVRYVHTEAAGASRARNLGARTASEPMLCFLDDDVRVHADWLRCLHAAATAAGARGVVSGRVTPGVPAAAGGFVPSTIESEEPKVYEGRVGDDVLYAANMMLHRTFFEELGAFDERLGPGTRFPSAEDNDFAHRLLEAGGRIHYAPEAIVEHRAWRTGKDYLPLRWTYGRGQGAFYGKHLDLRDRYILGRFRYDVTQRGIRFARLLPRQPRRAVGQMVYLGGLLTGAAQWLLQGRSR